MNKGFLLCYIAMLCNYWYFLFVVNSINITIIIFILYPLIFIYFFPGNWICWINNWLLPFIEAFIGMHFTYCKDYYIVAYSTIATTCFKSTCFSLFFICFGITWHTTIIAINRFYYRFILLIWYQVWGCDRNFEIANMKLKLYPKFEIVIIDWLWDWICDRRLKMRF